MSRYCFMCIEGCNINVYFPMNYRSNHNPHVRHGCPWLLGDWEWGGLGEIQNRLIAIGFPMHHQPSRSRDVVCGLQTRVLGVGSICGLLIEEVSRSSSDRCFWMDETKELLNCCRKKKGCDKDGSIQKHLSCPRAHYSVWDSLQIETLKDFVIFECN